MDANSDGIFLTLLCDLHAAVCMKSNKIWSKGQSGRVGAPKMVGATNSGMVMVMVMVNQRSPLAWQATRATRVDWEHKR